MNRESDQFIALLTSAQPVLHGYVFSLLGDETAARDVLQETNLTLWHKADDFVEGTSFPAWAAKVAYFHVLRWRRKVP